MPYNHLQYISRVAPIWNVPAIVYVGRFRTSFGLRPVLTLVVGWLLLSEGYDIHHDDMMFINLLLNTMLCTPQPYFSRHPGALHCMWDMGWLSWLKGIIYVLTRYNLCLLVILVTLYIQYYVHWQLSSSHDANFVATVGTGGFHDDNLQCHQWRQSWHHDDSWFSVWYWL